LNYTRMRLPVLAPSTSLSMGLLQAFQTISDATSLLKRVKPTFQLED